MTIAIACPCIFPSTLTIGSDNVEKASLYIDFVKTPALEQGKLVIPFFYDISCHTYKEYQADIKCVCARYGFAIFLCLLLKSDK